MRAFLIVVALAWASNVMAIDSSVEFGRRIAHKMMGKRMSATVSVLGMNKHKEYYPDEDVITENELE